ncbi:hypothetical protein [Maioricimonas rarisocia]|uniref:hypothetical protein n=1 Tax=Maioricimonas rarisocia TaxID=2528026 RepID=UPI0018D23F20|nr:hypothetical protein [Maioricimonas rarisocia]
MRGLLLLSMLCLLVGRAEANGDATYRATVLLVVGAPGTEEYERMFQEWTDRWREAAERGRAEFLTLGLEPVDADATDLERLEGMIRQIAADENVHRPLWIVLIGHGTFDGRSARFNLRGPDLLPEKLNVWLTGMRRETAIVNCTAASAPFIAALSGPDRVVVAATKSGFEINFARFGEYLSQAIGSLESDLDKDGQVSLLEAFLRASRQTQEFYESDGRLATEHALIDDDGDGLGTRAAAFEGVRPTRDSETGAIDGYRAHQWHLIPNEIEQQFPPELRRRRDELELQVFRLRDRKSELGEAEYYAELEPLLIEIAELYEQAAAIDEAPQLPQLPVPEAPPLPEPLPRSEPRPAAVP